MKPCGGTTASGAGSSPMKACGGKDGGKNCPLLLPSLLIGGLGAAAYLFGGMLETNGYLSAPSGLQLVLTLLRWILFSSAAALIWAALDGRIRRPHGGGSGVQSRLHPACAAWDALPERRKNLIIWLIMMAVALVFLLAVYPGFFVYDAAEELSMVQRRAFTAHHPLLHVLLLGGVILAAESVTGSYNIGIFVYLLLQAAVILAAFTYLLADLRRRGAGRGVRIFSFLWLLLCPTVTMFVLCSCKDGLFSAALIVMTAELRRMLAEPETFFGEKSDSDSDRGSDTGRKKREGLRHQILFVIAAAAMMLLRNNGVYAYAVFLVIAAAAAGVRAVSGRHRKGGGRSDRFHGGQERSTAEGDGAPRKRQSASPSGGRSLQGLALLAVPLVVFMTANAALTAATNADTSESQEILTVPLMQLARTWNTDPDSFTEEERLLMDALMEEGGWEAYDPNLSDQMKARFRSDVYRAGRGAFWRMWLRQAVNHPMTYLNAWLMTSYGFWYPEAIIDCYEGNIVYTYTYGASSYFGYETEPPGERASFFPALDAWFEFLSLDVRAQTVPVLHYVLSPGAMFWVLAFVLVSLLRRGQLRTAAAYLPILLVWMTVLLGPCTLPRYVVYLWFGLPMFLAELTNGRAEDPEIIYGTGRTAAAAAAQKMNS